MSANILEDYQRRLISNDGTFTETDLWGRAIGDDGAGIRIWNFLSLEHIGLALVIYVLFLLHKDLQKTNRKLHNEHVNNEELRNNLQETNQTLHNEHENNEELHNNLQETGQQLHNEHEDQELHMIELEKNHMCCHHLESSWS